MRGIITFVAVLYLIDWFVIRRAKKGKRTIIPLIIVGTLCFLFGTVSLINVSRDPDINIAAYLINSVLVLDILIMIFVTDYIANKHKK